MTSWQAKKNLAFHSIEELAFPREIQLQTHTACNAACVMCPYATVYSSVPHGRMSLDLFKKLIDECSEYDVWDLKPFLMNEPLLDRRLPSMIRYARARLPHVTIGFSTNGQLLEGGIAEELLECGLDEIWVNFNGNTAATYERIMKGLTFERTRRNVIDFKTRAVQQGAQINVYISTVETKLTLQEISASESFWRQYDIPVMTTPLNNRGGNLHTEEIRVLSDIRGYRVCDRPFYKMYIAHNGDVLLCSSDWRRETIVGNVADSSIYDVWHSRNQARIREWLLTCQWDQLPNCRQCDYIALYN